MTDVTESALVELTGELVSRPSENPPGEEGEVASFLAGRLEESDVGFEVDVREVKPGRANVVARAGDPSDGTILLTGHTDVVPAAADDWETDPFELRRTDGRLVGRGTSDMKGAVAAKLIAAEAYLSEADSGQVTVAFVVGEERGGIGTEALVNGGVDADGAIIGEPTDMRVCVAEKGVARYRITTYGENAHSGKPDRGDNAIDRMRDVLDRLEQFDAEVRTRDHPVLSPETATVTEIEGGLAPNIVPDETTITLDWRFHPGQGNDPDEFQQRVEDAVEADASTVEVNRLSFGRATQTDPDERIVGAVESATTEVKGQASRSGFSAITDARYLREDAGIPTVLFGPGSIERDAHTVDESVSVVDLAKAADVYRRALHCFFEA